LVGIKKVYHKELRAKVTRKQFSEVKKEVRSNKETVADFIRRAIDNELTR